MAEVGFKGKTYVCDRGQSLLDSLQAQGAVVPSGCRSGVCQSCLMRVVEGQVPSDAQQGLSPIKKEQGFFLACRCRPEQDMKVALPDMEGLTRRARVIDKHPLNREVLALRLQSEEPLTYRAGQYLRLYRPDGLSRCYSLASVPSLEDTLELHVRKIPGGQLSGWVHDELTAGTEVRVGEPTGECVYGAVRPDQPLILLGTGSGLAPLYGIVRDALEQHHAGDVWLYHGSYAVEGLYYQRELQRLAERHANFHYVPCVDQETEASRALAARTMMALDAVMVDHGSFGGYRIYLCGHPAMVEAARLKVFLGGASMGDILADPFLPSGATQ